MSSDSYRRSVTQKCGAVCYHNNYMTAETIRFLLGINIVPAYHSCNVHYCVFIQTPGSILLCCGCYNALLNIILDSNSKYYTT